MASDNKSLHTPVGSNQVEETQETELSHIEISEGTWRPININERRSPNKKGLTSKAWEHFQRRKIDGKWKAVCKYCSKELVGETKQGTSHLHDHISSCSLRNKRGPKQSILKTLAQSLSSVGDKGETFIVGNYSFCQDVARTELAQMIVLHEYPISIVDHIGFKRFCGTLQPLFKVLSRNTIKSDIMKHYGTEKYKTMKFLENNSSRVAITTNMWTSSNQNKGFMLVTTHYIDDNWTLQQRLVRFLTVGSLCGYLGGCP